MEMLSLNEHYNIWKLMNESAKLLLRSSNTFMLNEGKTQYLSRIVKTILF